MALPVTISGVAFSTVGYHQPPFISSAGNVYWIGLDSTDTGLIEAWKATDPTTSFSEVDSANKPDIVNEGVISMGVYQVGDVLHIATHESNTGRLAYHTFNMATDAWGTKNEQVVASAEAGNTITGAHIAVRDDGDIIILYGGTRENVSGTNYNRVNYARKEGSTWTVDVNVAGAGLASNWMTGAIVKGSSDRMHFFFKNDTASDGFQRCLTSANALETLPAAFDSSISAVNHCIRNGIAFVSGETTKVKCFYVDATSVRGSVVEFDSADAPTQSTVTNITDSLGTGFAGLSDAVASMAVKGSDIWLVWQTTSDSKIYRNSSPNNAGWGTAALLIDATTVVRISANVYIRSNNYKLAFVYDDGGTIKYGEHDLGSAGATRNGELAIAATASATATTKRNVLGELNVAATSSASAAAKRNVLGELNIAATSSASAVAKRTVLGELNVAATASASATAERTVWGEQNIPATASASATAKRDILAELNVPASASASATASMTGTVFGELDIPATASASATAKRTVWGELNIPATASAAATAKRDILGELNIAVSTSASAAAGKSILGGLDISASASASASAAMTGSIFGELNIAASGSAVATAKRIVSGELNIAASGSASAAIIRGVFGELAIAASASASATVQSVIAKLGQLSIDATSSASATAIRNILGELNIAATSSALAGAITSPPPVEPFRLHVHPQETKLDVQNVRTCIDMGGINTKLDVPNVRTCIDMGETNTKLGITS